MDKERQEETDGKRQDPVKQKLFPRVHWMPITVIILGLLSFSLLIWAYKINTRQRMNFALANAVMDIQIKVATFHLRLEEAISEETTVDLKKTGKDFGQAVNLVEAILNGGESERGWVLEPLKDSSLRSRLKDLRSLLSELERLAHQRIQDLKVGAIGSVLDARFDAVFNEFQSNALSLETIIEEEQSTDEIKSQRLFMGFFLVWAFIVAAAVIGLWTREGRRKAAERALQKTNEQLQVRTEELRKHQEHLKELVEERTAELTTVNRSLQQEIAERMEAERFLQTSAGRFRTLVENLPLRIFLKDEKSVYLYCNDNCARNLRIRTHEIFRKTDYDFYPQELAERHIAEDERILKSGKAEETEERYLRDGQEVIIRKIKLPIKDERTGTGMLLGIVWDMTERVRLESIAEAVNTMDNIGYVFAGIRHEIGNPVNSAKMTLSVLRKRIDTFSKETTEEYIERALGELSRVDYLLKTLKNFNMYETPEPQRVEIKPFMDKFLSLLTDDFGLKGIAIESILSPEAQWGYADPRALQQVLLNIMSNASDAMDGKNDPRIVIAVSKMDGHIRIKVTDNGCGISEEQQKRLFMPFFTTKASGTGLGLVIAKKLVSRMKGTLEIKSRRGEGTSVEISIQPPPPSPSEGIA